MKTIMKLQTIPDTLNVTELMGVKGGDLTIGSCPSENSGICTAPGSGMKICTETSASGPKCDGLNGATCTGNSLGVICIGGNAGTGK